MHVIINFQLLHREYRLFKTTRAHPPKYTHKYIIIMKIDTLGVSIRFLLQISKNNNKKTSPLDKNGFKTVNVWTINMRATLHVHLT